MHNEKSITIRAKPIPPKTRPPIFFTASLTSCFTRFFWTTCAVRAETKAAPAAIPVASKNKILHPPQR